MKKIVFFMISLFLVSFNLINFVYADCTREIPCCCQEYPGGEKKCFTEGICCYIGDPREFWNPVSCFDFMVWVEPTRSMFTVGKKTAVNLYIHNLGYTDNYHITRNVTSDNPHLIQVDLTGVTPVYGIAFDETRIVYPRITVLESHTTGQVLFNVTSESNPGVFRNATLTVIESELTMSLPEFEIFGLFVIILLAGAIFYLYKKTNFTK